MPSNPGVSYWFLPPSLPLLQTAPAAFKFVHTDYPPLLMHIRHALYILYSTAYRPVCPATATSTATATDRPHSALSVCLPSFPAP
ncbi:hypothetical protein VTO73DRAFT_9580 [Trametes versicolor]